MHLATVSKCNIPHVVPVWYMYKNKKEEEKDTGRFYVGTNTKTTKAKNILHTKKAAFSIDTGVNSPDIFGVAGQGAATLIKGKKATKLAVEILKRYYKNDDIDNNPAAQELLADTDCVISITPNCMTSWSY